jgi:hypothetical protein
VFMISRIGFAYAILDSLMVTEIGNCSVCRYFEKISLSTDGFLRRGVMVIFQLGKGHSNIKYIKGGKFKMHAMTGARMWLQCLRRDIGVSIPHCLLGYCSFKQVVFSCREMLKLDHATDVVMRGGLNAPQHRKDISVGFIEFTPVHMVL